MPSPRSLASAKPSASKPSEPTVPDAAPAALPIDKKKPYADYAELMAAVHAYCLAEYRRRWGEPWDGSWKPSPIRKKLQDEALTIEDVVAMEREAINAALHRHGESKRVAKERRAQASDLSAKRPTGGSVRAANPKRRAKAGRRA